MDFVVTSVGMNVVAFMSSLCACPHEITARNRREMSVVLNRTTVSMYVTDDTDSVL
jgi:hypothetical protein